MKDSAERVGRYQLLGPIGAGPCGAVSRAKVYGVAGFERQFAVKRFHPEVTITSTLAQALSAAARAYGSLEHPRIARMSEFGVAQGHTFTAVELVPGIDAARLIAEARHNGLTLAAGGALALVSQAARAVGYAHGRGLTHLGLSPSNVIVTAEGDVKITDFGILSAGLPQRPADVARLQYRVPYLAPEQIANEATSAATDVFQLGVIAYELVTSERTFRGETPAQVAQAILAGPPPEPQLPRPIVRVLARCLARSPFERFPDARALADALDAALRVAPVPGTRKDVGAQVKATMDRMAELNDNELSGMLHVGSGPVALKDAASFGVASAVDMRTDEFVRPDLPVPGPTPLVGPTVPQPPAPPAAASGSTPGFPAQLPSASTLMGIPAVKGAKPSIKPPSAIPPIKTPPPAPAVEPPPAPAVARTKSQPNHEIPSIARTKSQPNVPSIKPIAPAAAPSKLPPGATPIGQIRRTTPAAAAPPPTEVAPAPRRTPVQPSSDPPRRTTPAAAAPMPSEPSRIAPAMPATPSVTESSPSLPPPPVVLPRPAFPRPIADKPSSGLDVESLFDGVLTEPAASDPLDDHSQTSTGLSEDSVALSESSVVMSHDRLPTGEMAAHQREALLSQARGQSITDLDDAPFEMDPPPPTSEDTVTTRASDPYPNNVSLDPAPAPPVRPSGRMTPPELRLKGTTAPPATMPIKQTSRVPVIAAAALVGLAGLGIASWQVYTRVIAAPDEPASGSSKVVAATTHDAGTRSPDASAVAGDAAEATVGTDAAEAIAAVADAAEAAATDAAVAVAAVDAGAAPADAAVAAAPVDAPAPSTPPSTPASDVLEITSKPAGARVYLDGADTGVTPLKLPASPDKHTIALLLPGHELYIAQVDGSGRFQIPLTEVTPTGGPAGIKVIRCKDKDRYYVFVDGKPTGMMCPTERVNVELGPHTVEIYDAVTESRRKWDVVVKDTRLSYRVKIE